MRKKLIVIVIEDTRVEYAQKIEQYYGQPIEMLMSAAWEVRKHKKRMGTK